MFVDEARERRVNLDPGHPVSIMYDEHDTLLEALRRARNVLLPADGIPAETEDARATLSELLPVLQGAERNFVKQENAFFPAVERHGITQPPAIMWSEHDMMRELFKATACADPADLSRVSQLLLQTEEILASHVKKEENVVFQAALTMLSEAEWGAIRHDFDELGYLHAEVPTYHGEGANRAGAEGFAKADGDRAENGVAPSVTGSAVLAGITLPSGSFSPEVLVTMLNTLPVDITLVGADDTVLYFSESSERIFPRARSVVGRSVQNCHPPKSVHVVQEILDSFRKGSRDSEEFYLHLGEKYIYIRYYALRDQSGGYQGCLEVSQNIAPIQAIKGEKRIL